MDAARWKRTWKLFDEVVDASVGEQSALLASLEADAGIRAEVERLLQASQTRDVTAPGPAPALQPRLQPGTLVDNWRVERLIGRGGMGEVYLAQRVDADFEQRAALKLLLRMESEEDRTRFAAERRILARLEHPSIARLLDGSEYQGTPYAVMEYVDGQPVTDYARHLPLRERLGLVLQACDAVGHAHRHLVVHRDLKPGNMLVSADGRLRLLDFGIAKHLSGVDDDATQVIRASPDYCAPEQLDGGTISTATDVFALGVIMFELLTGERPWQLGGLPLMRALERLWVQDTPRPSSRLRGAAARAVRGDLDTIVLKALQPEPGKRYRNTDELAYDLKAHLQQRPIRARKPTLAYVVVRTVRRHRLATALAGVAAASLLLGLGGVIVQGREAAMERDHARREVVRNDAVRQYLMLMFRSAGELQGNDDMTARDVLARAADEVDEQFANDPEAHADISIALSELFFQLNDYTGARPLLERLVQRGNRIPADVRAMAQHDLAQVNYRESRIEEAWDLLRQAQAFWSGEPRRYQSELLDSRLIQSQLERADGDFPRALATLEQALEQRIALSGRTHRDTAVLINNLGITYFQAGQLEQASDRFQQANSLWTALGQERSADALNTLNNLAAVEARLLRSEQAAASMRAALQLRRELYGPSTATAALLNNLGKTLSQLGRHQEAIPLLREAIEMGQAHAGGPAAPVSLAAGLGLAEALAGIGSPLEGHGVLDELLPLIRDAHGEQHLLAAMLGISRARIHYSTGARDSATQAASDARRILASLGPGGSGALEQLDRLEAGWRDGEPPGVNPSPAPQAQAAPRSHAAGAAASPGL